jgi:hypothetical protein
MEETVSRSRELFYENPFAISRILLVLLLLAVVTSMASASNIYVAQSGQGANSGADCADALPATFFNSSANWGSGGGQIGPGVTVHLCGTISTNLTFQGNGANGNPVVLDGTGATISAYIVVATQYWTIQNCTWSTSYATNSGTQAVIETSNGAAFGTIQNNQIQIQSSAQVLFLGHVSHDINVINNYMKMTTPSAGSGFQSDVFDSEGSYNVLVEGNVIAANIGAGDQNCGGCHDDLIQVWAADGSAANSPYNWTIRYNKLLQESSPAKVNNQSLMMMENIGMGTAGYWNVYSNLFQCVSSGSSGNGIVFDSNGSGMTAHLYNNTVVQNAGACNNLWNMSGPGAMYLSNNITYNTDAGNALTGGESFASRSGNLWYGPNTPSCSGFQGEICGSDPLFTNYSGSDFTLQSGSPARGAAANEGTSYNLYPVPETTWPDPTTSNRPSSGSWDIGTYQFGSGGGAPNPPSGLTASVQ